MTCTWTLDDCGDGEVWETACGQAFQFFDGSASDNKMKFCCYCGKPLEEVRTSQLVSDEDE